MKTKYYSLLLLIVSPFCLLAQVQLRNLSLQTPDSAVLYMGVYNTIAISGLKHQENITVRYNDRVVSPDKDGHFQVTVARKGTMAVAVYAGRQKVKTVSFSVRKLTDPVVVLGQWRDEVIPKDSLLHNRQLKVILPGCLMSFRDEVMHFDLQIIAGKKPGEIYHIKGNSIPDEFMPKMAKLQSGDRLLFTNIRSQTNCIGYEAQFTITLK